MNNVSLLGRLGANPELREVGSTVKCRFSLATSEKYKGEEKTQWHSVVAWGKLGELINKYLEKGNRILIQGKIEYGSYENKEGVKINYTEIVALNAEFIDVKKIEEEVKPKKETFTVDDIPF